MLISVTSLNLSSMKGVLLESVSTGEYYLFLEDDMKFCPHGLTSIQYLLNKASLYHPDWLGIYDIYIYMLITLYDR